MEIETETIKRIKSEIPIKDYNSYLEDALKRFGLSDPRKHRFTYITGRSENARCRLASIARALSQQDFFENKLTQESLPPEEGDLIKYVLAREVLPSLEEELTNLLNEEQYNWLYLKPKKVSELYQLKDKSRMNIETVKKEIENPDILLEIFIQEAEEYEIKNAYKLADTPNQGFESPKNRTILAKAGDKWMLARNFEKAETYYLRAGPWEYEHAARNFEKAGDNQKAIMFWTLAAKKPTGYSDEVDCKAGSFWEKAGNIPEAIKSFKGAIEIFELQEGCYDLHGDLKPGKAEADSLREKVTELEKLLTSKYP